MPRIYTRRRGKSGKSLRNAITYKNWNGIHSHLTSDQYAYIGSGSYGSIYATNKDIVFKLHKLDDPSIQKCTAWEHEFTMQKKAYDSCNQLVKKFDVCIAKPYTFRYTQTTTSGLEILSDATNATSCIFTMDRILGGTKWNRFLRHPVYNSFPAYIFLGTLESGPNRITLDMLKDSEIVDLPNEAYSFCKSAGPFGTYIQSAMIEAFFTLLEHEIIPRDIEFVLDGRKHTQTLVAIIDFNEAKTVQERQQSYGEGYDVTLDAAHVYIDLCGLRVGNSVNPMAPYDSPTPQWRFLCNPMICPSAFLVLMQEYRLVAERILEYAWIRRIRPFLQKASWKKKPVYVYQLEDTTNEMDQLYEVIGILTEQEYIQWRNAQCVFHTPRVIHVSDRTYTYVGSYVPITNPEYQQVVYDPFVEFDIQFQNYIVAALNGSEFADFHEVIASKELRVPEVDDIEGWEEMSLF